jgi:hypothetical protein
MDGWVELKGVKTVSKYVVCVKEFVEKHTVASRLGDEDVKSVEKTYAAA